jgi:hypothetical protein
MMGIEGGFSVNLLSVPSSANSAVRFGRAPKPEEVTRLKEIIAKNYGDEKAKDIDTTLIIVREYSKSAIWTFIKRIFSGEIFSDMFRYYKAMWRQVKEGAPLEVVFWNQFATENKATRFYERNVKLKKWGQNLLKKGMEKIEQNAKLNEEQSKQFEKYRALAAKNNVSLLRHGEKDVILSFTHPGLEYLMPE